MWIDFRRQDVDNRWYVVADALGGGELQLQERVAGTPTQRGASTISAGQRLVIVLDDETIQVYADNTLKITYSSAANFKTETGGVVNNGQSPGQWSDLVTYPRTLSGKAVTVLNKAIS